MLLQSLSELSGVWPRSLANGVLALLVPVSARPQVQRYRKEKQLPLGVNPELPGKDPGQVLLHPSWYPPPNLGQLAPGVWWLSLFQASGSCSLSALWEELNLPSFRLVPTRVKVTPALI